MLHSMGTYRGLDQMLNDNGRLSVDSVLPGLFLGPLQQCHRRRLSPPCVTEHLEIFIHNVGRHYRVDHELAEALSAAVL
jgi:hypothetical protein